MNSTTQLGRKKAAVGVGAVLLLAASLITVSAAVSAQSGPTSDCSNDNPIQFGSEFFGSEAHGNLILSNGPTERVYDYDLAAGSYEVSAVSTDGYIGRDLITQPEEQWFAQFLSADGMVLATTGTTGDVEDLVETGFWTGSIGEINLEADATQVRVVHIAPGASVPNSVRPVCLGATPIGDPATNLDSSITVDFDSENIDPSVVSVVCGEGEPQSDEGTAVDLVIDPVTPGEKCTVEFPADHECTMFVTADGQEDLITVVEGDGMKMITFPADASVDVLVDIDCNALIEDIAPSCDNIVVAEGDDPAVDPETGELCNPEPEVLNEVVTNPAVDTPTPEVLSEVVTAPVAQVQPGNPTFTG